jgi:hypothetical protein
MVQTLQAREITLSQLAENFGLTRSPEPMRFADESIDLPGLSAAEMAVLDEVKAEFDYLSMNDVLEPIVKMVVLSPLLRIAGFFRSPFQITAEKQVELVTEDEGFLVRGLIDLLVFDDRIWVATIEAKRSAYSLKAALPQLLSYMLTSPVDQTQVYGLVTNGNEFRFVKLVKQTKPSYQLSNMLVIDQGDDLYQVAKILKLLGQLSRVQG